MAREKLNVVLDELDALGLDERGGIVVIAPSGTPFAAAQELERSVPGDPADAFVWDSVETEAEAGARPTLSFQVFLTLVVLLAAIAVVGVPEEPGLGTRPGHNLALATAFWELSEMRGSALQLVVNVAGMLFAGTLTLLFLRVLWTPITLLGGRVFSRE